MKLREIVFAGVSCIGLTACGIAGAGNARGYSYVSDPVTADNSASTSSSTDAVGTTNSISNTGAANSNTAAVPPKGVTGDTNVASGATTAGGNTTMDANATNGATHGGNTTVDANAAKPPVTYAIDNLAADMNNVLQQHMPVYSADNLGNPANVALWTPSLLASLYDGLVASQAFYPNLSLQDLAHLILALGATDSTGDYRLSNNSSVGYLQVATSSCEADYIAHGLAIVGPDGQLLSPSSISLNDPGANVVIMAWYTRNAVSAGESANEAAAGQHLPGVTRDVGNAILSWLVGPGSDRHALVSGSDAANRWPAFYNRILDYYVQGGFGTQASFDAILNTSLPSTLEAFKDAPANAFP